MQKFQKWLRMRETTTADANSMDHAGNTDMALGSTTGNQNTAAVGTSAGVQDQGQGQGEDSALMGNMKRHLDMLIADLEKTQRIPRAKSIEILDSVVQALKGGGMMKGQAMKTLKTGFQ